MSVRNVTWKRLLLEKRRGESYTEVMERTHQPRERKLRPSWEGKMEVDQLSANEVLILEFLIANSKDLPNLSFLAKRLGLELSTVSRMVSCLEERRYVQKKTVGRSRILTLNKNKKPEIDSIITLYQNCKSEVENSEKVILRVHNMEY